MKRLMAIFSILVLIALTTACSAGKDDVRIEPATNVETSTNTNDNGNENMAITNEIGIIVKSDNILSSQEKEDILNELDKNLDDLFNSVNNLEDVDESKLDFKGVGK